MTSNSLTTEEIRKKFKNSFDLCHLAINIARILIQEGTPVSLAQIIKAAEERASETM